MASPARGVKSKVLCVGLGKTGTKTFADCMRQLGFNHRSMHGTDEYARGDFDALLRTAQTFDSFDDFPWPYLYKMFEENFTDVKFILTRRKDVETWYTSLCRHYCRIGPTLAKKLFYGYYSPYEDPDHHMSLYLSHNQTIRSHFEGRDDFLEVCWEEGDGWQELCSFLDMPVPDIPFPMKNVAKVAFDYEAGKRRADAELEQLHRAELANSEYTVGRSAVGTKSTATRPAAPERRHPASGPRPRMLDDEIELLSRHLVEGARVLEFGCGGSTLLALRRGVAECHSVETDRAWVNKLRAVEGVSEAEASGRLVLRLVDIGPTRQWGMPTDRTQIGKWPAYYLDVWSGLEREPDVVLIDGRFRTACALLSLLVCPPSTSIFVHDFYSTFPIRKNYHLLLEVSDIVEQTSDLVSLRRKGDFPNYKIFPYLSRVIFDYG